MRYHLLLFLIFSHLVLMLSGVPAEADASNSGEESAWDIGLALGGGQRSNPLANSDDINLWWNLNLAWYGERWFFDNGDLGFMLRETESYTVNWVNRIRTERAFFSKVNEGLFQFSLAESDSGSELDPTAGPITAVSDPESPATIPDRDYAFESGIEFLTEGAWGDFQAQLMTDVSSTHKGSNLWLGYGYDLVYQRWHIRPSASLSWKSRKLNDYYYGVRNDEANAVYTQYQAGAGLNASAKFTARYFFSESLQWVMTANYERLSDEAADSPLLEDNYIVSWFAGLHYRF